jgi:hypothetical protein
MTQEMEPISQEQVDRLWEKFQAFYDGLSDDEQWMLARILDAAAASAEGGEVTGHALMGKRASDMSVPPPPRLPKLPFSFFRLIK